MGLHPFLRRDTRDENGDRYQQAKVYWRTFSDGQTGWSDTSDSGPSRPLFNALAIRKF